MPSELPAAAAGSMTLGGDLVVRRMGFGAMRAKAHAVLRRAVELGVNLIDTADSYGPEVSEKIIAEALHPYPAGLVIATKGGLTRSGPGQWHRNGRPERDSHCVCAGDGDALSYRGRRPDRNDSIAGRGMLRWRRR